MIDIEKTIKWWNDNYKEISNNEGWAVSTITPDDLSVGLVVRKLFLLSPYYNWYTEITSNKCTRQHIRECASLWGWIVDGHDYIIDFDIDKFSIRNHLITGHELGLL